MMNSIISLNDMISKALECVDAERNAKTRKKSHTSLLIEDNFEPLEEEPLKRTTDWLASKDESRFEELYTAYAAGLYAAQKSRQPQNGSRIQEAFGLHGIDDDYDDADYDD